MTDPADRDLVQAAGRGDLQAFEALYARYRDWTVSLALRFCRNREDALDAMQETFAYLARKLPGLDLTCRLKTFLYPVVKHLALSRARAARRETALKRVPERSSSVSVGDVDDLLTGLSEAHRETVLLRFVDGLDLKEIAEALEIPLGTVKSRLHEAIEILKRNFKI